MTARKEEEIKAEKIKARAYYIWEEEGRPTGREKQHWEQARREIEVEAASSGTRARKGTNESDTRMSPSLVRKTARKSAEASTKADKAAPKPEKPARKSSTRSKT